VIFAVDRAGIVGEDGATHNGIFDIAFLRSLPHMTVLAPADGEELAEMLGWAVNHNGPVAIRYPRGSAINIQNKELGAQSSEHGTLIIALGSMVGPSIEAAKLLGKARVINARSVKPLDKELILNAVKGAEQIVTVEEGVLEGGFGSAVMELLNRPVLRLALPSEFIEHGKRDQVLEKYGLTAEGIANAIERSRPA
jgi:1-deoxy-D-xylulose-5-phosphate synthase